MFHDFHLCLKQHRERNKPSTNVRYCADRQLTDHIVQCFSHHDKVLCPPGSAEMVLGQGWDEILKGDVFQEQIKVNSSVIDDIAHRLGGSHLLSGKKLEEFPYVDVHLGHVVWVSVLRDTVRG